MRVLAVCVMAKNANEMFWVGCFSASEEFCRSLQNFWDAKICGVLKLLRLRMGCRVLARHSHYLGVISDSNVVMIMDIRHAGLSGLQPLGVLEGKREVAIRPLHKTCPSL